MKKLHRPVIQFRVHHEIYEDLKATAKVRKLSISEECQRRLAAFQQNVPKNSLHDDICKLIRILKHLK